MDQVIIRKRARALEEADLADIRQAELMAAQNEFWKLRQEISNRLDTLTLVQLQKMADKVREISDGFNMSK